jgi:hypothetical protein
MHQEHLMHLLLFVCCVATVKALTALPLGIASLPALSACLLIAALWANRYSILVTTSAPV